MSIRNKIRNELGTEISEILNVLQQQEKVIRVQWIWSIANTISIILLTILIILN